MGSNVFTIRNGNLVGNVVAGALMAVSSAVSLVFGDNSWTIAMLVLAIAAMAFLLFSLRRRGSEPRDEMYAHERDRASGRALVATLAATIAVFGPVCVSNPSYTASPLTLVVLAMGIYSLAFGVFFWMEERDA